MPLGARHPMTAHKIKDRYRRARALELRKQGLTFQAIADTVTCPECFHRPHPDANDPTAENGCRANGCECVEPGKARMYTTRQAAMRSCQTALREVTALPSEELQALELERCDALQSAIWGLAMAGDPQSYQNVLRTMERRAKLLGLDDFDRRMARLEEVQSRAAENVVDQFEELVGRVFARLELPPDAAYRAPQILREELERAGYADSPE